MKQYRVYTHPSGSVEAIKEGWSWPACLLGLIWALFSGLWLTAFGTFLGLFAVAVLLGLAFGTSTASGIVNIAGLFLMAIFGQHGNDWLVNKLLGEGYELLGCTVATDASTAIAELSAPKSSAPVSAD
ncbi:DUF2628 domain-containing protein [soil metagenome]